MGALSRRRALKALAATGVTSIAGCVDGTPDCSPRLGFELHERSESDLVDQFARFSADLPPVVRSLTREAARSGSAILHGARHPPTVGRQWGIELQGEHYLIHPANDLVRVGDTYYRIRIESIAEGSATSHQFVVAMNEETNAEGATGDSIPFEELPIHDRRSFLGLLSGYTGSRLRDADQFETLASTGYLEDETIDSSQLIPESEHDYVQYRSQYFVRLDKIDTGEATLHNYELSLEEVAETRTEFRSIVTENYGTDLTDEALPEEQRQIVREAVRGTYWECAEYSESLLALIERLEGTHFVNYDDSWYTIGVTPFHRT